MKTFTLALLLLAFAPVAQAAELTIDPNLSEAAPGSSFTLTITLSASDAPLNVVEGGILVPAGVIIDSASYAGSPFTLWPTPPQYAPSEGKVIFSGGIPGGIASGGDAKLFVIRAHADAPGTYVFSPRNVQAYRNDGQGTLEAVDTSSAAVTVHKGAKTDTVSTGATQPLVAAIGSDPALFDGKYFVAFYGGDRGEGVLRYEVKEGVFGRYVPAARYYVLIDQSLGKQVSVRAVDAHGVVATKTLPAEHGVAPWILGAALIALLGAAWRAFLRPKKQS